MQTAHKGGIGIYRHLQRSLKLLRSSHSVRRQGRGLFETVAVLLLSVGSPEATLLPAYRSQATSRPEYGTITAMDAPVRTRKPVRLSAACREHCCGSITATQLLQQLNTLMGCSSRISWLKHCHTRQTATTASYSAHNRLAWKQTLVACPCAGGDCYHP